MRGVVRFGLGAAILLSALAPVPTAAQFDDDFEDEFAEPEPAPEPAPAPAPAPAEEDPFAEDGDDPFAEDAEDPFAEGADAPEESEEDPFAEASEADDDEDPFAEDDAAGERTLVAGEEDEARRNRLFLAHNTYLGSTGGWRVVDASSGPVGSFRLQLGFEYFRTDEFLAPGDVTEHTGGSFSLSWTVWDYLEVFASIQSYANRNTTSDPQLFQVLGDSRIGLKGFYPVTPVLGLGADLEMIFLNQVGSIGLDNVSAALRAALTADLRGRSKPIPFIFRFNFQYLFDNSSRLIEGTEDARFAELEDPARDPSTGEPSMLLEDRHLITPVERYSLTISRVDMATLSFGIEIPLAFGENKDWRLHPLLEWSWGIPVNRQDYTCLSTTLTIGPGGMPIDDPTGRADGEDSCLNDESPAVYPMDLTLGFRFLTPLSGLSFAFAADIGLTGTSRSNLVRELPLNNPYNIYFAISYAYDTNARGEAEVREVERRVEVPVLPPMRGRVSGTVKTEGSEAPIAGATIRFPGRDVGAILSGDDGRYTSFLMEPGEVTVEVSHPEHEPATCTVTIPDAPETPEAPAAPAAGGEEDPFAEDAGDEFGAPAAAAPEAPAETLEDREVTVALDCVLAAAPTRAVIAGLVSSADGDAVGGASVQLTGPASRTVTSDAQGLFRLEDVPPGTYTARVEAEGYLIKLDNFTVAPDGETNPNLVLIPRPARALVNVQRTQIRIRRRINFATASAEILDSSLPLMNEIADVLLRNPQITRVEIQGHTDDRGNNSVNRRLSQNRAQAVLDWLVAHGVAANRLEAKGYGPDRPLVPNITPANRARNRRVQFVIRARSDE
ncbi:MAG: carboxypeptidase regulatory-like domain-containing protein [Myxococcota bacterium]